MNDSQKDSEKSSVTEQSGHVSLAEHLVEIQCSRSTPEDSKARVQLFGHASFAEQLARSTAFQFRSGGFKGSSLTLRPRLVCRACKYPTAYTLLQFLNCLILLIVYNYLTVTDVNVRQKCPGKGRVAEIIS